MPLKEEGGDSDDDDGGGIGNILFAVTLSYFLCLPESFLMQGNDTLLRAEVNAARCVFQKWS